MAFCYILECADGTYYVGSTVNLEQRLLQHQGGTGAAYTRRPGRRPVRLVYAEEHPDIGLAFTREKQIQGWSRAKRRALIEGSAVELSRLSRRGGW